MRRRVKKYFGLTILMAALGAGFTGCGSAEPAGGGDPALPAYIDTNTDPLRSPLRAETTFLPGGVRIPTPPPAAFLP